MNERYLLRTETLNGVAEYSEHESLAEAQDARDFLLKMVTNSINPMAHALRVTIWHSVQEGGRPDTETT